MIAVGREQSSFFAKPEQDDTDNVEHGYQQSGESYYDGSVDKGRPPGVADGIADRQEGENISEGETSGVAHEYFFTVFGFAKYIIIKEG